jgi:hypothetical protein
MATTAGGFGGGANRTHRRGGRGGEGGVRFCRCSCCRTLAEGGGRGGGDVLAILLRRGGGWGVPRTNLLGCCFFTTRQSFFLLLYNTGCSRERRRFFANVLLRLGNAQWGEPVPTVVVAMEFGWDPVKSDRMVGPISFGGHRQPLIDKRKGRSGASQQFHVPGGDVVDLVGCRSSCRRRR